MNRPCNTLIVGLCSVMLLAAGCSKSSVSTPATQPADIGPSDLWTPSTTQPVSSTQPSARGPEYLNLLEAVFRYQFEHNASGSQRNVDYFFLTLDHSDPPPELLERFRGQSPRVLPRSLTKASAGAGVTHKDLGGSGLIFYITRIAWLDANTADVDGGYYEAGLSSSGNTYHAERRNGKWVVTKDEMHLIS